MGKRIWLLSALVIVLILVVGGGLIWKFCIYKGDQKAVLLDTDFPFLSEDKENSAITELVRSRLRTEKQDWFSWWSKVTPFLTFSKFTFEEANKFTPGEKTAYAGAVTDDSLRKEKMVYAKSPNQKMLVDPLAGMMLTKENGVVKAGLEPDSSLAVIDLDKNTYEQVLTCGTPCGFDDAVWLDNSKILVLGYDILFKATNNPDNDSDYAPALWVVDLDDQKVYHYVGPTVSKAEYLKNNRAMYFTKRYGGLSF